MSNTSIEWSEKVWNPTVGCTRVSPGCAKCYAFALHDMRHAAYQAGKQVPRQYALPFKELQLLPDRLDDPLHWKKPCRIFVNSMSDLFHEDIPDEYIDKVFATMAQAPRHAYQILTKRTERMRDYLNNPETPCRVHDEVSSQCARREGVFLLSTFAWAWPLGCVWLGVSVENQEYADRRIPLLLQTPAAVRFLSCEPLLGPVDVSRYLHPWSNLAQVGWIILGGESGAGARSCDLAWLRALLRQGQTAGIKCFVKQVGKFPHDSETRWISRGGSALVPVDSGWSIRAPLKDSKGGDPLEWEEGLRVRDYPGI